MIWTIFFNKESNQMPQDFVTKKEAVEYGKEVVDKGFADSFEVSCTDGDIL